MAQQPYMGSGLLFPASSAFSLHSWQLVTSQLAALLFYRSWCDSQSHLAGSQETWVRNGGFEFSLWNIFIHARKVLLHAVRKWCYGFLSPLKIHRPRSGSNPRTLGPVASTLTTSNNTYQTVQDLFYFTALLTGDTEISRLTNKIRQVYPLPRIYVSRREIILCFSIYGNISVNKVYNVHL
jgi:hypothetical protein